jgi:uncharacterized protein (DUF433 family)
MPIVATKPYIESRNEGYWIVGTRVALDSIVYEFQQGRSPESIVLAFPVLNLEQVYGAIVFYLANRVAIDAYLLEEESAFDAMPQPLPQDSGLYQKLQVAKAAQQ